MLKTAQIKRQYPVVCCADLRIVMVGTYVTRHTVSLKYDFQKGKTRVISPFKVQTETEQNTTQP